MLNEKPKGSIAGRSFREVLVRSHPDSWQALGLEPYTLRKYSALSGFAPILLLLRSEMNYGDGHIIRDPLPCTGLQGVENVANKSRSEVLSEVSGGARDRQETFGHGQVSVDARVKG
jgi:hypothetical protein